MQNLLKDIDGLLVSNQINVRYLTGFSGANPTEREAYVLVTEKILYLLTHALNLEAARKLVSSSQSAVDSGKIEVVEISREKPLSAAIKEVLDSLSLARTITLGYEDTDLTVAEFARLKEVLTNTKLTHTRNRVEELRMIKRPDEIEKIKKAAKLTDDCFLYIQSHIKPEISEAALAWEIEKYFKERGASLAFDSVVAFGSNASMPHYSPSVNCKLQNGNLILLDFAARVDGYCADMTRMLFFGKPTDEQKKAYKGLLNAQEKTITALKNGERSGAALDTLVRNELEKETLPAYPHSLGHGLGLSIHESPSLSFKMDMQIQPGMVITIEPGIYIPNKFGMRTEDLLYIKEDNTVEILSLASKEMIIL